MYIVAAAAAAVWFHFRFLGSRSVYALNGSMIECLPACLASNPSPISLFTQQSDAVAGGVLR